MRYGSHTTTSIYRGNQMIRHVSSCARNAGAVAAFALALFAFPAAAQKATFTEDFGTLNEKFSSLADAMGADTYGWRPMEGVRSVSEVYMLIAAEAYFMPSFWGADPPEGMEITNQVFGELSQITEKDAVLEHLEKSFAYATAEFEKLSDDAMEEVIPFFGQERSIADAIYLLLTDMHEHLGQAIAYARTNEVVPPWSAGS
ncbi:MAG: DinB family protein [Gemmatimonadota bacterium]|nr:DinB family protein [Gemmatimonadota bacterium]